tara:strand:+ start:1417 stop:1626 length:210 start_codon:yes stop_codon:yes gene_type:complete
MNENIVQPDINTPMPLHYYVEQLQLTSRSNLWKWTKQGLRTHQVGGRVYISQANLQRFFNERTEEEATS